MGSNELSRDEYFKSIYENAIETLERDFELVKSTPFNMSYIVNSIEFSNATLGKIELCYKNNLDEGKKYFYKATLASEWFFIQFPKKDKGYEIESDYVSIYVFESLYNAILSGNRERAIRMAQLYGSIKVDDVEEYLPTVLLGYSLKYTILDDKIKALEYIEKLEDNKGKRGMKQYAEGHAHVFRGIIEHDEVEFNKGLEFMLRHHVARMRRNGKYLEEFFAYDSVALAMLAKDRGLAITVKHDLLPMGYLEDTDIDYSKLQLFSLD